jgi:ADYC domain
MNSSYVMKRALLISWLVWGCAGGQEPDQSIVRSAATGSGSGGDGDLALPWTPEQGMHLLGSAPDLITGGNGYIHVSNVPAFRTKFTLSLTSAADGAHLVATDGTNTYSRDHAWFTGLILSASDGGQIKITGATEVTAADLGYKTAPDVANTQYVAQTAASTEYTLLYRAPVAGGYGPWEDYCGDFGGGAVPLLGRYDQNRGHTANGTPSISFGCGNGITYKCTFWGYGTGNTPGSDAWKRHGGCDGAGNARYCGDRHSFTREKTPIWIVDQKPGIGIDDNGATLAHPDPWPGDPDTFYIEAGWTAEGTPICLSRLRWVSLPPNPCPGVLEDPRYVRSDHEEVFFCDEKPISELFRRGAVVVNGSEWMDAVVGRWSNGKGDTVSTIRGFVVDVDGDGQPDRPDPNMPGSVLPFADANGNSDYRTYLGSDGMLLRNLPGTLDESQMMPLYVQNLSTTGDHYLSDTGGGRSDPSFEGYSFIQQTTTDNEDQTITGVSFNECKWSNTDHDTHLASSPIACAQVKPLGFAFEAP